MGDEAFQLKCMNKIRSFKAQGRTIILVTHSMGQVQDLCDRVVLLNQGEVAVEGEPPVVIAAFRDLLEGRRLDRLANEPNEPAQSAGRVVSAEVHAASRAPGEPCSRATIS